MDEQIDVFTERYKFKDIMAEMEKSEQKGMKKDLKNLKELIKAIAKEYKLKEENVEFIRKKNPLKADDIKIEDGERAAIRYINTADVDRDNEIVMPDGGQVKDFQKSMTVLYAHDYWDLPIGRDLWIKLIEGKGWLAKTVYAEHQKAVDIYNLVKDRFLNTSSIGFIPLESVTPDSKGWDKIKAKLISVYGIKEKLIDSVRRIYTKWILLEHSDVPIPSNINALNIAVGKGYIKDKDILKDIQDEIQIFENKEEEEKAKQLEKETPESKEEVKSDLLEIKNQDIKVTVNITGVKEMVAMVEENFKLKKRNEELEIVLEDELKESIPKEEKPKDKDKFDFEFEKKKEENKPEEIELNPKELKDIIIQAIKENVKGFEEGMSKRIDDNFKKAAGKVV